MNEGQRVLTAVDAARMLFGWDCWDSADFDVETAEFRSGADVCEALAEWFGLDDERLAELRAGASEPAAPAMAIVFVGEAYESFQAALDERRGYGVSILLAGESEPFEAVLAGADHDAEDGATVLFWRVDDGMFLSPAEYLAAGRAPESGLTQWIEVS